MIKKIIIGILILLLVGGCKYKPDLSDPWTRFCYNLELDDFTYVCVWENMSKTYNTSYILSPIIVDCEMSTVFYQKAPHGGDEVCGIESTELGYSIFDIDYPTDFVFDGINSDCYVQGESLNKSLELCYDMILKELKDVSKEVKEK